MKRILFFSGFLLVAFFASVVYIRWGRIREAKAQVKGTQVQAAETECDPADTANWCQVGRLPDRTSSTPEVMGTSLTKIWVHAFQPDKVMPSIQAIVYHGKVYVGTEGANAQTPKMYAFDIANGNISWSYPVDSPIVSSVAAGGGKIYFGTLHGTIYALNENNSLAWSKQVTAAPQYLGFVASPLLVGNKLMVGSEDGKFYALDTSTGNILWQYDTGSPIFQAAAYNNGKVFFGTLDSHVFALNDTDGSLAWKSERTNNLGFLHYWPVVYGGNIFIRPVAAKADYPGVTVGSPFGWNTTNTWITMIESTDPAQRTRAQMIVDGNFRDIPSAMAAQDTKMGNPGIDRSLYIYDENASGTSIQETFTVPHWSVQTHNLTTAPPCVDRDGYLVMPVEFIRSGWGRLDMQTRRIVDIFFDNTDTKGAIWTPGALPAGMGNKDENMAVTCTNNLIYGFHIMEGNANYTGFFDMDTRKWKQVTAGHQNTEMYTIGEEWANPPVIANGKVYHISEHNLIVRQAQ